MLKDIIEAQTKKAREQSKPVSHTISSNGTTNSDGFFEITDVYVQINLSEINTLITETAQIVAREVLRKVREGVPEEIPSMPDLCIDSHEGWLRSKNTLLDHLQSLEDSLLKKN